MKRRPVLTRKALEAMRRAMFAIEAAGPEALTGYDDEESQEVYEHLLKAIEWSHGEIERRNRRKKQ